MADPAAVPQPRPGMPDIVPSGSPQPFTAAMPTQANQPVEGSNFAAEFMAAATQATQPQPQPQQPQPQQPQPQQPQPVLANQPPLNPQALPRPVVPQPQPQPQPQPPVVDRYSTNPAEPPIEGAQPLPEIPPDQNIPDPQGVESNPQQNHAWAELRAQRNQNRKLAEDYRVKYNDLLEQTKKFTDEKSGFADQLNQKDQEIQALQDDIGKLELSRSPAFRAKYDAKLNVSCDKIVEILKQNGVDEETADNTVYAILNSDPKDVPDMISNLPTYAQGEIMVAAHDAGTVLMERAKELEDWRNAQAGYDAVAERDGSIQTSQRIQQNADRAIEIVRGLTPDTGQIPAYRVVDPTFAKERDDREAQFKQWVGRASEEQRYAAMLEGFMAPKTYEMLDQVMRENLDLKRQMRTRASLATPMSYPTSPQPAPPPPPPPKPQQAFARADTASDPMAFAQNALTQLFQ